MAIDPNKLVSLEVLQRYISSTISLVKDNFAKKNMTVTNIELVNEIVPPDTERKNYLKIFASCSLKFVMRHRPAAAQRTQ